jgi:hypothetical protein
MVLFFVIQIFWGVSVPVFAVAFDVAVCLCILLLPLVVGNGLPVKKTYSKTSASYENTSDVFVFFLCSCLLVSGVLSHGWCAMLSFDLEMVVTWLVGLRYGIIVSFLV